MLGTGIYQLRGTRGSPKAFFPFELNPAGARGYHCNSFSGVRCAVLHGENNKGKESAGEMDRPELERVEAILGY